MNEYDELEFDRDCARLASALTAYFDGEATPAESRTAREHLRACQSCAHLWHAWSDSRALLQSVPVPAAPPGFLLRILTVCRLSALRDATNFGQKTNGQPARKAKIVTAQTIATRLNLQSFNSFRNEAEPVQAESVKVETKEIAPREAPEFLLDAIRGATTRAHEMENVASFAMKTEALAPDEFQTKARTRWHRAPRLAATYAVPALLLFLAWPGGQGGEIGTPEAANDDTRAILQNTSALELLAPPLSTLRRGAPKAAIAIAKRIVAPAAVAPVEKSARAVPAAVAPVDEDFESQRETDESEIAQSPQSRPQRPVFRFARFERADENRASPFRNAGYEDVSAAPAKIAAPAVEKAPVPQNAPRLAIRIAPIDSKISVKTPPIRLAPIRLVKSPARHIAPRLLTPVSFAPAALRSRVSSPIVARETPEANVESSDDFEDKSAAAVAVDSYRAALAEDIDSGEISS